MASARFAAPKNAPAIVHVVARYPPALGGMETAVRAIAREQHDEGMQVRVITTSQGEHDAPIEDEGFPVSRLKSFVVANTPMAPALLFRLLSLKRQSVVHLHIAQAYTPELVWLASRLRRTRYVAHFHADVIPTGRAGLVLEPYKRIVLSRVMRGAAKVLVPTDDYKDLVCEKYELRRDQVAVVDNGSNHRIIEQPKSPPEMKAKPKLLFVGRLAIQKNVPLLLQAVATYRDKYGKDFQLSVVGDGDLRPAIESEIRRLELGSYVTLTGPRHGAALESTYDESDLLLLTSVFESFGLVLVEGMAKAVPIVSVRIPAVRNVVLDEVNGLLVDSTPEALADAINRLLSDRDLYAKISINNLATSHRYTWESVVSKISIAYESVK